LLATPKAWRRTRKERLCSLIFSSSVNGLPLWTAREHPFTFNEAVSLMVNCDTQDEIDYYWEKLSAVPEAEQCGWLKDKYNE
jgi:predicted 3-demethylubiquinone-9 3-methyltransferase (glyoxalase superfamily)